MIFDEIVTGFRFAYGGAQELYGVTPDICTLGKIFGGGFMLAPVAGRLCWAGLKAMQILSLPGLSGRWRKTDP